MASEFLSDREQEEALRNWWRENWRWVLSGVAVGFALLGAWNFWQRHVEAERAAASAAFRNLTSAIASNDKVKVEAAEKALDAEHSGSAYTDQAHLLLAQSHVNGGRFEQAASELKIVVEKTKDPALAQVAKLRLARVQNQLGHYDEALTLLDVSKAGKFAPQFSEVRGDALLAKGDASGARKSYEAALAANAAGGGEDVQLLQLKLQDLQAAAESPTPNPPAPTEK